MDWALVMKARVWLVPIKKLFNEQVKDHGWTPEKKDPEKSLKNRRAQEIKNLKFNFVGSIKNEKKVSTVTEWKIYSTFMIWISNVCGVSCCRPYDYEIMPKEIAMAKREGVFFSGCLESVSEIYCSLLAVNIKCSKNLAKYFFVEQIKLNLNQIGLQWSPSWWCAFWFCDIKRQFEKMLEDKRFNGTKIVANRNRMNPKCEVLTIHQSSLSFKKRKMCVRHTKEIYSGHCIVCYRSLSPSIFPQWNKNSFRIPPERTHSSSLFNHSSP